MSLFWEEGQHVQDSLPSLWRDGKSDSIPKNDLTKTHILDSQFNWMTRLSNVEVRTGKREGKSADRWTECATA